MYVLSILPYRISYTHKNTHTHIHTHSPLTHTPTHTKHTHTRHTHTHDCLHDFNLSYECEHRPIIVFLNNESRKTASDNRLSNNRLLIPEVK